MVDKIFPIVLIGMMLTSSIICFCVGDIKRGIYWLAGAVINMVVTF